MKFSIGDKVIHPRFGAGQITAEEHRELVKGFEHYYVIKILRTGATAYVPVRSMGDLGVRRVMSGTKMRQVLDTLRQMPRVLSSDYKQRQQRVEEKLATGLPILVAETVRDLMWHRERKRLTQKDEVLLNRGQELLASEIALAADAQIHEAQETINSLLRASMTDQADAAEGKRASGTARAPTPETLARRLMQRVRTEKGVSTTV